MRYPLYGAFIFTFCLFAGYLNSTGENACEVDPREMRPPLAVRDALPSFRDIPLLPSMSAMGSHSEDDCSDCGEEREGSVFTVHWLDNKHHHAMAHLNKLLHETLLETQNGTQMHQSEGMPQRALAIMARD